MAINSKKKGVVGEQELSAFIREAWGVSARRSQQFKGTADSADLETGIKGIHIECKRVEAFRIYDAIDQATLDCGADSIPVVAYRRNRGEWLLVLKAKDAIIFSERMMNRDKKIEG